MFDIVSQFPDILKADFRLTSAIAIYSCICNKVEKKNRDQAISEWGNVTCLHTCGISRHDAKHRLSAVSVSGDVLYVAVMVSRDIFSPITQVHTWGSFTFMVIQIMKLSIQEILRWEQWTQLPPAACEMGWYGLRQMGEAAVGQQSNHIHLARFPVSPVHALCCNLSTGGCHGTWDHYARGPTVLQTLICAIPEVHFTPAMFPPTTYTPEVSLFPHVWS